MKDKSGKKKEEKKEDKKYPLTRKAYLHFFYGILFPGLGHFLMGKKKRAYTFAACLLLFFMLGLVMDGHLHRFEEAKGWIGFIIIVAIFVGGIIFYAAVDKMKELRYFLIGFCIFLLFVFFIYGFQNIFGENVGWLDFLAILSCIAVGIPYFISILLGFGAGDPASVLSVYGNYFVLAAGLLNILVALDAMDIAAGRKK
jgi:hypothetical protein